MAVSALIITPVQAANLIQNGSFENGVASDLLQTINAGSTVITGWTVSQGLIHYINRLWKASNGSISLHLGAGASPGGIKQTFNTTVGGTYRVTFDLAGNPNASPIIKEMRVSAGGSSADFSFDTTGKSRSNMGWVSNSWDFTANSTTTTLEFIDLTNSFLTNSFAGPALDNVSVIALSPPPTPTPIPEPSSVLGLLSLGVLGIGSALKRQS
ncbi:MAG: choice-of-anchor C family protein [Microcystis sp. M169S2]|nr:choice-of-anchor C family protein [Microcystis sp. M169S2]